MRKAFRSLIVAAALMGAANVGFSQAPGDPREAIARLGSFPGEVEKIQIAISQASLPAGAVIGVIGGDAHDCRWVDLEKHPLPSQFEALKFGNLENQVFPRFAEVWPNSISFPDLTASLQSRMQTVHRSRWLFAARFMPMLQKWAQTSLSQSSAAFSSASAEVLAVQDEMKKGIGPNDSQRQRVIAALDRIVESLGSGKGQLTGMADVLSGYLQEQRGARGSLSELSEWSTTATGQVQSRAEKIRGEIKKRGCPGDYQARVDTIVRNANASIAIIAANIRELQKRDDEANKAVSILLGTFVGYASHYEAVADRLKVAKEAPLGSTIQDLHLSIAAGMWQDLVDAAKKSGL